MVEIEQLEESITSLKKAYAELEEYKELCDKLHHSLELTQNALHEMARINLYNSIYKWQDKTKEEQEQQINKYISGFLVEKNSYQPKHYPKGLKR